MINKNRIATDEHVKHLFHQLSTDVKSMLTKKKPISRKYYKTSEMYAMYGLSENTLKKYRREGVIKESFIIGGYRYYPENEIISMLEKNRRNYV